MINYSTADFLGKKVNIYPPVWLGKKLEMQPGDLSQFAPKGNGVYGLQEPGYVHPFKSAPQQDALGGIVYLDDDVKEKDLQGLLNLWKVITPRPKKDYAVFLDEAKVPNNEGYISQMRIVSKFALSCLYRALDEKEYENFPEQEYSMEDLIYEFIKDQKSKYGGWRNDAIKGLFGGDGDYAYESLSFGLMLENEYFDIFRIWSRAWLVTK